MKENKLTCGQMANMVGCSELYLHEIINGKQPLSYEMALYISEIFNMKPDELFYDNFVVSTGIRKLSNKKNNKTFNFLFATQIFSK